MPGEHERDEVAGGNLKLGDGRQTLAARGDRSAQLQGVRPPYGLEAAVTVAAADPGHDRAVVEADHQLHPHRHPSTDSLDQADHVRRLAARRHAVDHPDDALSRGEVGLQHQGARLVAAGDACAGAGRRDPPAAMLRFAEQGGEAGRRVEPRKAQPVDAAVPSHQRRSVGVSDASVVLDVHGAGSGLLSQVEIRLSRSRASSSRWAAVRADSFSWPSPVMRSRTTRWSTSSS